MKYTKRTLQLSVVLLLASVLLVLYHFGFVFNIDCIYKSCSQYARCCPKLVGNFHPDLRLISSEEMANKFYWVHEGGRYSLSDVSSDVTRVAILIPFRKREEHLQILLNNLHPFLYKQQLDYTVYVVDQVDEKPFNKGKLYNIGYTEAKKNNHTCYVFHDVDLIPENDHNLYGCVRSPMHLSRAIDKYNYSLPDDKLIGGVSAWRTEEFERVNGWSNLFWFWGGEDDDMSYRIMANRLPIYRFQNSVARYRMLKHSQSTVNTARHRILKDSHIRYKFDGLSSLVYIPPDIQQSLLYTRILVKL
ncbi:beta-1,4-N-acetylgalactosaminyltransferase bre-4-like isoform X2 [Crassostrea virginica]